jgi:tetratricopeptide (TPR) repeat protein
VISTRTKVVFALILAVTSPLLHAADPPDPNSRLLHLERWIKASLAHRPGETDDAVTEVSRWSTAQLHRLRVDELMLLRVLRTPRIRVPVRPSDDPLVPAYTAWQLRHLRELADEYRDRNDNDDLMVRGAVLHGDVAMSSPRRVPSGDLPPIRGDIGAIKVLVGDGEPIGINELPIHWDVARGIFDDLKDNARASDVARRWYVATSTWMQNVGQHDTFHLRHARTRFPEDVDLQFLSGCQQETYASPAIQAAARTAVLPTGYYVDIASDSAALRDAEGFFRRALALNPSHEQARLHLGHVLVLRGRPQEAVTLLRQATFDESDRNRRYFAALFLGAAEEGIGRFDEARDRYIEASAVVPLAQSPYIALSALAARRGDRATALKQIGRVFELPVVPGDAADPWWAYYADNARDADELLRTFNESVGGPRQ